MFCRDFSFRHYKQSSFSHLWLASKGRRKIPPGNLALREGGGESNREENVDRTTVSLQMEREMEVWLVWTFNLLQEAPLPLQLSWVVLDISNAGMSHVAFCGAGCCVMARNSQPDPRRARLPFTKGFTSMRSLVKNLPANGETPLCFHLKFIFFSAISGLFSKA